MRYLYTYEAVFDLLNTDDPNNIKTAIELMVREGIEYGNAYSLALAYVNTRKLEVSRYYRTRVTQKGPYADKQK